MEPPIYTYVKVDIEDGGHVAIIKYNRPKSGNSLHPDLVAEMLSALRWADNEPTVRVIIQSGEGRFFCTGMELLDLDAKPAMTFAPGSDFHSLNKLLISSKKILIAAVNGPAAGYGVSSLALFDLVYSVPDAYFFTPFVKWGMANEGASSFSFPRLMGYHKAAALCLAGDRITADEADKVGLVTKILPKDGFFDHVIEIATRIAQSPQGALRTTKALMKQPVLQELLDANDRECAIIDKERFGSGEYLEAIKQFKIDQEQKRESKSKL
ncbi:ClpP/crotonase-like domain-containing protein [Dendryphion nanum]|uniref:ClpP/crotonase-like domain-containing protein n=1 Tax=Dendryphion nanum TaxID=256645 RepID=A0A9P9IRJ1_9PLEO|nr:ClpP/crotonase-like domain-containing protein [Dendryphion nanum]